jgi:hypothetical protein
MSMSKRGFFKRLYEIHGGGELLATLSFDGAFGGGATGVVAGESWTFKRTGFFTTRVALRKATSEFDDGVFQNRKWSHGGTLTFPDGRTFSATTDRWGRDLQFVAESGETVMSFRSRGKLTFAVDIEVMQPSADVSLFLLLGCYIVAMMSEESASTAAAATVATMA